MVDPYQLVLGLVAIVVMIGVPLLCVLVFDLLIVDWDDTVLRWRDRSLFRRRRPLRRKGPPLEQVAADLRRLRATLVVDEHRSAAQQLGNRQAYDQMLKQACTMLELQHELDSETTGFEREIERLRVEVALESAGLVLSDHPYGNGDRHGQAA